MTKLAILIALTGGIAAAQQQMTCSQVPQTAGPFTAVQNCYGGGGAYTLNDVFQPRYAFQAGSAVAVWVFEDLGDSHDFKISDTQNNTWLGPFTANQRGGCCTGTGALFIAFNVKGGMDIITIKVTDKAASFMNEVREYRHSDGILTALDPLATGVSTAYNPLTNQPTINVTTSVPGALILTGNIWADSQHPVSFCPGFNNHTMMPPPIPGGKLIASDVYAPTPGTQTLCLHASLNAWAMWSVAIAPPGGVSSPIGSVSATAGTPQEAQTTSTFALPLEALVKDGIGAPVNNAQVAFAAPNSGPTASFSGATQIIVLTDNNGIATASATANGILGSYTVTATTPGLAIPAQFNLTNTATVSIGGGAMVGSYTTIPASLTGEGTADWIHWGDSSPTSIVRKAGVPAQISTYTKVGNGAVNSYTNDPRGLSWSDGTPLLNSSNNFKGISTTGVGKGFTFTAPAGAPRTLTVHLGGYNSGGTFTAHLADGSAADFVSVVPTTTGVYDRNFTINYQAATASQLVITWTMAAGTGNVRLSGAALQ